MITFDKFKYYCNTIFGYLEKEYGFKETKNEENRFGYYITYQNSTTAIRISYEPMECGVFVLLSRLINDDIPKYPVFIKPETIINSFYLDDIIKLKMLSSEKELRNTSLLNEKELETVMNECAHNLKQYATDILKGNFKLFEELDVIVKWSSRFDWTVIPVLSGQGFRF